jgi:hypothetical protein
MKPIPEEILYDFQSSEPNNVKIMKELGFSKLSVQIDLFPGIQDPVSKINIC